MARKINAKAWDILCQDEQTALSLQLGLEKSSWESGEIMNKSHYKYLEILYRAEKFLKLFTQYICLYDCLIPDYVEGEKIVLAYLRYCIEERKFTSEAFQLAKEYIKNYVPHAHAINPNITKEELKAKLVHQLKRWEKSENPYDLSLFNLVKEFDRFNNFRILPREIQEPSAFKRRVKNVYKRYISVTHLIPELSVKYINRKYRVTKAHPQDETVYFPIMPNRNIKIIPLDIGQKRLIDKLTSINLYIFKNHADAKKYIEIVHDYAFTVEKTCKDGLDFWPQYRDYIQRAINYQGVNKISPNRKYLEMAMKNRQFFNKY